MGDRKELADDSAGMGKRSRHRFAWKRKSCLTGAGAASSPGREHFAVNGQMLPCDLTRVETLLRLRLRPRRHLRGARWVESIGGWPTPRLVVARVPIRNACAVLVAEA